MRDRKRHTDRMQCSVIKSAISIVHAEEETSSQTTLQMDPLEHSKTRSGRKERPEVDKTNPFEQVRSDIYLSRLCMYKTISKTLAYLNIQPSLATSQRPSTLPGLRRVDPLARSTHDPVFLRRQLGECSSIASSGYQPSVVVGWSRGDNDDVDE